MKPMRQVEKPIPTLDRAMEVARATGIDASIVYNEMVKSNSEADYFINDIYQVTRHIHSDTIVQLNIRRRDGKPILRDWRHFQQIKNELVGEENEAVELYPAESRKTDTSNKYHLWCLREPGQRFPFGFNDRMVLDSYSKRPGLKQRKL